MKIEYAIVVKNKTRLESLIERFNTLQQAKFYIERLGGDFADYEAEHEQFHNSLDTVQRNLSGIVKYKLLERTYLPSYIFADNNVIVVVGQDGLVANTAKYSRNVPMVAVNPDKSRYDGQLLPFNPSNFAAAVDRVMQERFESKQVSFAEALLNDGQRLLAFNDLFIGASTHISARYRIRFNGVAEEHSSSGLIVSTPAGCTGWMSSIFNMAYMITNSLKHRHELDHPNISDDQLLFAVREPFQSVRTQIGISCGLLTERKKLVIESLMPSAGVIFSDGIESDFLKFNSGSIATIGPAKEKACLVI